MLGDVGRCREIEGQAVDKQARTLAYPLPLPLPLPPPLPLPLPLPVPYLR